MTMLDTALDLAAQGFFVFPLKPDSKLPAIMNWQHRATRDPEIIKQYWQPGSTRNIGIMTSKFGDNQALLVVDIDKKGEVDGFETARRLEAEGKCFRDTLSQDTPSGGRHLIYRVGTPVRQGVSVFGRGIDVRSRGGYIVGPGSTLQGRAYTLRGGSLCDAEAWVVEKCGERAEPEIVATVSFHSENALQRAQDFVKLAPKGVEGNRNQTLFKIASMLKDFGCKFNDAVMVLDQCWICEPKLEWEELTSTIKSAYGRGEAAGSKAPEIVFKDVEQADMTEVENFSHVDVLNKNHAFITIGSGHFILEELKDFKGSDSINLLSEQTFHRKFASKTLTFGEKPTPITKLWMNSKLRRSYDGLVFNPGREVSPNFYNLWRGFAVKPFDGVPKHEAVEAFLSHLLENVCQGDKKLARWLTGYFAQLIQRPWEKPLTALVFRGKKGVGKNALIDRVGALLGGHYMVTADRRYLVGNFNSHLENCLLFTLDEAFWSGDKSAEGVLKNLVTGNEHNIERKGVERYKVDNCTRVCILGNEDWLVPASHDERRYAVFQVGDGRKQDRKFFHDMRVGMEEKGGYGHLLRYLQDFDLTGLDFNEAPITEGLKEQKEESLDLFESYWFTRLLDGQINDGEWPNEVLCTTLRDEFRASARRVQSRKQLLNDSQIGRKLKSFCPGMEHKQKRIGGDAQWVYKLPELEVCRKAWEARMGYKVDWNMVIE